MPQAQATHQHHEVNGVDVTAMDETVKTIQRDPAIAKFRFRSKNHWVEGAHNQSEVQGFYGAGQEDHTREKPFTLTASEPPVLLGKDEGPNPAEHLLHALASCMTTSTAYHAAAQGIEIESIESSLEGDIDLQGFLGLSDQVRQGFQEIRVKMKVKTKAPKDQVEKLHKLSPILDTVSQPVSVKVEIEMV